MRMSKFYVPTLREVPSEAELVSHQLLLRAGMMRMLAAGVYTYLPLGLKVIKKIEAIVRDEMDGIDSQETLMSVLTPAELWQESGRWDVFGPEMFRLKDRHGREFCLGPTHEEVFTNLIRHEVKSYKQLPLSLYQIQTKFRDEKRPRFGLMRGREFVMKDAYTFDRDVSSMQAAYKRMWEAYERVFTRCGLDFKVVEGDSGAMGGSASHEFIALSPIGETEIIYCSHCAFAATTEKAPVVSTGALAVENTGGLNVDRVWLDEHLVHTQQTKTIEALEEFFSLSSCAFAKTLLYKVPEGVVAVVIPGDRTLNEVKLAHYLNVAEHDLEMASPELVLEVTGAPVGYAGPVGLKLGTRLIVDSRVATGQAFVVGANREDYHLKNICYGEHFVGEVAPDLLLAVAGDACPGCGAQLNTDRGNEVGNIFQLGTKYSEALRATYLDENGKEQLMVMGSHGIGITRTLAAVIEQHHDEAGIVWPMGLAPYQASVIIINHKDENQVAVGEELYKTLKAQGYDVLLDDRPERAGVKFKDAELMGIPMSLVVGKGAAEGLVELKLRRGTSVDLVAFDQVVMQCERIFKGGI